MKHSVDTEWIEDPIRKESTVVSLSHFCANIKGKLLQYDDAVKTDQNASSNNTFVVKLPWSSPTSSKNAAFSVKFV